MAEEEDVVFINSPLFEHLTDVGFTDFDAQCFNNVPEQVGRDIGASTHSESSQHTRNRHLTERFFDFLKTIYGFLWCFVATSTNSKEIECHSSYLSLIKESKLLTEDNEEFIFRFEKCIFSSVEHDINTPTSNPHAIVSTERKRSWFTFIYSNIIIGFMVLIAIILGYFTTDGRHLDWINTSLFTSLGVFLCICLCKMCFIWWNIKIDHLHDQNLWLLRTYFEAMEGLLVLSRKTILFIQEKELLARGHIIISPMVPIARIESNSAVHRKTIKQCIVLRKCIFTEIKNCLGILQIETKALSSLSLFENSQVFHWLNKDILRIDMEWLNTGLDVDTETSEFSLVLLKQIIRCLVDQQSLLLCYASLMSLVIVADKKQSHKNYLAIIKNCFEHLLDKVNKHSHKINQCYRFHRAGATYPGNVQHEAKIKILNSRLASTFSPFLMAVHSMNIHLQEASRKSLSIEEKLDAIDLKTTSVEEFAVQHFDEIENELMCMKRDLNNLTSCWDESHNRLHGLFQSFIAQSEKKERCGEENTCDNHRDHSKDDVQILSITGDIDVVPDQVFEGETFSELDDDRYCSPTLDSEELFKKKVREENGYLLQELKSVLATKDEKTMVGLPTALLSKKLDCETTSAVNKQAVDILENITSVELLDHPTCMSTHCTPESCEDQSKCDSTKPEESIDKDYYNHSSSQSMFAETNGNNLGIDAGIEISGVVNPFASMIAAAALARNKEFGFKEQRYEIDDQIETFGDEA